MGQSIREMALEMADLIHEIALCCQNKDVNHASRFNVSTSECRTLRVFQKEDNLTMKNLSKKMNLAMSRMTRIVDGLVRKDYVKRGTDQRDRRICLVSLTESGSGLVKEMQENYLAMNINVLESVEPSARTEVIKALKILKSAMKESGIQ